MHRNVRITALAALLAAMFASIVPGHALASGAGSRSGSGAGWGFKLWAATTYVAPLSESEQNVGGVTAAVKASNVMGYELGGEFRSGLIGFAFDYLHARQDLQHDTAGLLGTTDFNPISASLLLHLPTPLVELSAGPTVSYVNWGDLELRNGSKQPLDPKLGYGVTVGGDFPLAKALAITGGMRWLKLQAKPMGLGAIAVDPLVSHVGLALRF